ncbi:MAG: ShlB/FhaC/HecB family hemolysin secretion/activation protein [Gammaproteobacteria bacterium]|nr:ShlB/FhaC/HecB family hemolysin secretion/activation protein [Gammaproteobacteria bacterium]
MFRFNKAVLLISLLSASKAFAVATQTYNSAGVNPANITWDLESQLPTAPANKPAAIPYLAQPKPTEQADSNQPTFILKGVKLLHQSPVPAQVQAVYQKSINKPIDFQGVKNMAAEMQATYRNLGDILVQVVVPPQEIDKASGVVQLQVIEGQIQEVVLTGDASKGAKTQLERYAAALRNEDPITYKTMDHFITLANNLPGIDVTATLVPSKTLGASDLMINVKRKAYFSYVSFNNYSSQYIGPGQALAGVSIYDLFAADSLSVSASSSTANQFALRYYSVGYDVVTGPYSTEINPVFSRTVTHPGAGLTPFDMVGVSSKSTLNVNQPLLVSSRQDLTFISSLYHLSSSNSIFTNQLIYNDLITAATAGLQYKGVFLNSYNDMDAYTTVGLPILGAPATPNNPSRANGVSQFIILDVDTSTTHYITRKLSFVLAGTGQITPNPLLTSEQLGFGGMQFGQGFNSYVISGDNGIMGSFALRYDLPLHGYFNLLQPQVFYNAGYVGNNDTLAGTYNHAWGQSAGVGLNVAIFHSIQIAMNLAKPLTLSQGTSGNNWQAFINATAIF